MTAHEPGASPVAIARIAGVLYLIIIVFGISGEAFIRGGLIAPGDAGATATNILNAPGLFRLGFVTDSLMILSDVALAALLFILLKPVNRTIALIALLFRLTQTALLALNLLHYHAAILILARPDYLSAFEPDQLNSLSYLFLDLHAHGYDLGLILFGLHCLLLGYLILKSGLFPKALGVLTMAATPAYLTGSYVRFLLPLHYGAFTPIYAVALVAEFALCLWLLIKGVNAGDYSKQLGL